MVDVGAKPATKRTAIAISYVSFSNPEPFRLIFENANKKGDVLGLARVAGIMGAKRTSDLIPLCHPIPISKVELDVKLLPPGKPHNRLFTGTGNGLVSVEALVECTGPTGVEMEALTAVTTSTLTVYDMCKAADRGMHIRNSVVVYKSGGNSGLYVYPPYAHERGKEYFVERGLEVPDSSTFEEGQAQEVRKKTRRRIFSKVAIGRSRASKDR
jgi:cyclic pyranopterin phosphate synthase